MSEEQLAAILLRYEGRTDEYAELVRALISSIKIARTDADAWQDSYNNVKDRLQRVVDVVQGR